jgi:hypothetical protein
MNARQNKPGMPAPVKRPIHPAVHAGMAGLAGGREVCCGVVWRFCRCILAQMAWRALGAQTAELAICSVFMTGLTIHRCMCANERESICVIFDGCQRDAPAADGMTLFTITPHLAAMKIRMTIGATFPRAGKFEIGVTLPAV